MSRRSIAPVVVLDRAAPRMPRPRYPVDQIALSPAATTVAPVCVSNVRSTAPVVGLMRSSFASSRIVLTPRGGPANQTPPAPVDIVFTIASGRSVATFLRVCGSRWSSVPEPWLSTQTPPSPAVTRVGSRPTSMFETTRSERGSIIATAPVRGGAGDAFAEPRATTKTTTSTATTSTAMPATATTQRGTGPTFRVYDLGMRTVLILAAAFTAAGLALVARAGGAAQSQPTYYRDVAPILDAKCASCHR